MVNNVKVEISPEIAGKAFAHASDWEQGSIINSMARELFVACKGGNNYEMQCCHISDKLDDNGVKLINELAEFIKLREDTAPKTKEAVNSAQQPHV